MKVKKIDYKKLYKNYKTYERKRLAIIFVILTIIVFLVLAKLQPPVSFILLGVIIFLWMIAIIRYLSDPVVIEGKVLYELSGIAGEPAPQIYKIKIESSYSFNQEGVVEENIVVPKERYFLTEWYSSRYYYTMGKSFKFLCRPKSRAIVGYLDEFINDQPIKMIRYGYVVYFRVLIMSIVFVWISSRVIKKTFGYDASNLYSLIAVLGSLVLAIALNWKKLKENFRVNMKTGEELTKSEFMKNIKYQQLNWLFNSMVFLPLFILILEFTLMAAFISITGIRTLPIYFVILSIIIPVIVFFYRFKKYREYKKRTVK